MTEWLPWWAGALGLAFTSLGYYLALGRVFGVSGSWERVLRWKSERETEVLDAQFAEMIAQRRQAAAASAAASGDVQVLERAPAVGGGQPPSGSGAQPAKAGPAHATPQERLPVSTQATFLAAAFIGGVVAALTSGRFEVRTDMGPDFANLVVDGWLMWPVLFFGGILVGVGTRMSGGCSSGHGLNGCGRIEPASILATCLFFGTAVVMSTLLWKVI